MILLKITFLILAIMYGFTCFARMFTKQPIYTPQIVLMSIGIVGFVTVQWLV